MTGHPFAYEVSLVVRVKVNAHHVKLSTSF